MNITLRRLASATPPPSPSGSILSRHPLALLPPIPLYRRLLRAHRHKLPKEERLLGDMYIKDEWRRHREVENPVQIIGFLTEWQLYAQALEGGNWREEKLDEGKLGKMSDEQIGQLYALMQTVKLGPEGGEGEEGDGGIGGMGTGTPPA